ncbi:outer membrane beta-barrel protein [Pedobacter frigidisoli]|uniref:outer membrane beta-barrel protein n=1 Tax=Pedobacter frigidisoli TaxID=2530455 RepID=UPI002930386C|nr:outer membrane beta-barrel protein [Pedobacter frigidisoli]
MKNFLLLISLLLLLAYTPSLAQTSCDIKGSVTDSTKKAISGITVKITFGKDSSYTTTDDRGSFSFFKISAKSILLNVGGIGYKNYAAKYTIKPDMSEIDVGTIILKGGEISLEDVVIKAKPVAIKYKQDTVEYDANAFHIQEDDRVSDLLKQLPGVEIDENDNVIAMGKGLTKLRVNGRDFFTNNVKDFISKLPAGIVSKIQVIDDFGDQANFTGIKVGESQKMLNIVTKPGMDNGQFGGFAFTGGTNKQIGGNGNVNLWNATKQSNGNIGYNVADNGAGISENRNIGFSHSDKLKDKGNFGVNYSYRGGTNNATNTQAVETVSSLGKLNSQIENRSSSGNNGHNFSLNYNQISKKVFLLSSASFETNNSQSQNNSSNLQTGFTRQDFINNTRGNNRSPSFRTNLEFSKKLTKNTFSGNFSFSSSSNQSEQNVVTNTLYYNAGGNLEKDSLLNRTVYNKGGNRQFSFGLTYGISLKKDTLMSRSLNFSYRGSIGVTNSDLQTFVLNPSTFSSTRVDSLSVLTKNSTLNQSLDLRYYQTGKKGRLSIGLNARPNLIRNEYPEEGSTYSNNYINISPTFSYSKTFTSTKSLSVNYNGQNNNPGISQMQPVRNTQNLQNIVIGNPDLKSSFSHSVSSNFNYFGKKSEISVQSGLAFSATQNEIVNNIILIPDTLGAYKQETRFENVNGNYNVSINYNINIPFKSRKYTISIGGNAGNSRKTAIVNSIRSFNKGYNISQNLSGTMNTKKLTTTISMGYNMDTNNDNNLNAFSAGPTSYNLLLNTGQSFIKTEGYQAGLSSSLKLKILRISLNGRYNTSKNNNNSSTTSLQVNTQIHNFNFGASGTATLFTSYYLNFSANKQITRGYSFNNTNPFIINLGAEKAFFKSKVLSCSINVNDLLNQGNNISQQVLGNSVIESRSNQVTRVVTFGLNYNISRFGGKSFRLRKD